MDGSHQSLEIPLSSSHLGLLAFISVINLFRPNPLHPIFQPVSHLGQTSIVVYTFQSLCLHLVDIARFPSCPLRFLCSWQSDVLIEIGPILDVASRGEAVVQSAAEDVAVFDCLAGSGS